MILSFRCLLVPLTLCLAAATARAALIEYQYVGTVGSLDDLSDIGYVMPASPGDTFTATFVIESDTPDADPTDTKRGAYVSAVKSWTISIAGQTLAVDVDPLASVNWYGDGIYIDINSAIYPSTCPPTCHIIGDWFQLAGSDWLPDSRQQVQLSLFFGTVGRGFLSSDELPLTAIDPQSSGLSFDNLYLTKFDPESGANSNIFMNATAVIPLPAAVSLFGSALGMMNWLRRKATA